MPTDLSRLSPDGHRHAHPHWHGANPTLKMPGGGLGGRSGNAYGVGVGNEPA